MKTRHKVENDGSAVPKNAPAPPQPKQAVPPPPPFAGKPLDGSQYLDVIEEQQYAEKRSTPEEEKPRHSYLNKQKPQGRTK